MRKLQIIISIVVILVATNSVEAMNTVRRVVDVVTKNPETQAIKPPMILKRAVPQAVLFNRAQLDRDLTLNQKKQADISAKTPATNGISSSLFYNLLNKNIGSEPNMSPTNNFVSDTSSTTSVNKQSTLPGSVDFLSMKNQGESQSAEQKTGFVSTSSTPIRTGRVATPKVDNDSVDMMAGVKANTDGVVLAERVPVPEVNEQPTSNVLIKNIDSPAIVTSLDLINNYLQSPTQKLKNIKFNIYMTAPIYDYVIALVDTGKYSKVVEFAPEVLSTYAVAYTNEMSRVTYYRSPVDFAKYQYSNWGDPNNVALDLATLGKGLKFLNTLYDRADFKINLPPQFTSKIMSDYVTALRVVYPHVSDTILSTYVTVFFKDSQNQKLISATKFVKAIQDIKIPRDQEENLESSEMTTDLQQMYLTVHAIERTNKQYSQYLSPDRVEVPSIGQNLPLQQSEVAVNKNLGDANNLYQAFGITLDQLQLRLQLTKLRWAADLSPGDITHKDVDIEGEYELHYGEDAFIQLNKDIIAVQKEAANSAPESITKENLDALVKRAQVVSDVMNRKIISTQTQALISQLRVTEDISIASLQKKYSDDLDNIHKVVVESNGIAKIAAEQTQKIYKRVYKIITTIHIISEALDSGKPILPGDYRLLDNDSLLKGIDKQLDDQLNKQCRDAIDQTNKCIEKPKTKNAKTGKTPIDDLIQSKGLVGNFWNLVSQQLKLDQQVAIEVKGNNNAITEQATTIADTLWIDYKKDDKNDAIAGALNGLIDALGPKQIGQDNPQQVAVQKILDNYNRSKLLGKDDLAKALSELALEDIFTNSEEFSKQLKMYTQVVANIEIKKASNEAAQKLALDLFQDLKQLNVQTILNKLQVLQSVGQSQKATALALFTKETGIPIPADMDISEIRAELQKLQDNTAAAQWYEYWKSDKTKSTSGGVGKMLLNTPEATAQAVVSINNDLQNILIKNFGEEAGRAILWGVRAQLAAILTAGLAAMIAIDNNQNLTAEAKKKLKEELLQDMTIDQANVITAALTGADIGIVATGDAEAIATSGLFNKLINSIAPGTQTNYSYNSNEVNSGTTISKVDSFKAKYSSILNPSVKQIPSYTNTATASPSYTPSYTNTATASPSYTPSYTNTATASPSYTPSYTNTATASPSYTPSYTNTTTASPFYTSSYNQYDYAGG